MNRWLKKPMGQNRGIALTVVILAILMVVAVAFSALTIGFHQRKLTRHVSSGRTKAYYAAQAGQVDARERLRREALFDNPNSTADYTIDVDGDGTTETRIQISKVDAATGLRTVRTTSTY